MTFNLSKINSEQLFMGPTPIQKNIKLSKELNKQIYIKRDDRTGFMFSGNKIRKLSYLLNDALTKKSDMIITCGGLQSNHARATAFAATELGLKSCLLLRGEAPAEYKGNFLLDKLVGAEIRYISKEDWINNYLRMEEISKEFQSIGRNPYIIPEGGSNHIGSLGYMKCFNEILEQSDISFSDVFSATGSGGTTAGLLLGKALSEDHRSPKIHTINVCDDEEYFQKRIGGIIDDFKSFHRLENLIVQEPSIFDGYVGPGYAENTPSGLKEIADFCSESGVLLDPVYTGKAFFGMVQELKQNPQNFGDEILFIHTGGGFANFSFEEQFKAII